VSSRRRWRRLRREQAAQASGAAGGSGSRRRAAWVARGAGVQAQERAARPAQARGAGAAARAGAGGPERLVQVRRSAGRWSRHACPSEWLAVAHVRTSTRVARGKGRRRPATPAVTRETSQGDARSGTGGCCPKTGTRSSGRRRRGRAREGAAASQGRRQKWSTHDEGRRIGREEASGAREMQRTGGGREGRTRARSLVRCTRGGEPEGEAAK
jgi:hypothetical protein